MTVDGFGRRLVDAIYLDVSAIDRRLRGMTRSSRPLSAVCVTHVVGGGYSSAE